MLPSYVIFSLMLFMLHLLTLTHTPFWCHYLKVDIALSFWLSVSFKVPLPFQIELSKIQKAHGTLNLINWLYSWYEHPFVTSVASAEYKKMTIHLNEKMKTWATHVSRFLSAIEREKIAVLHSLFFLCLRKIVYLTKGRFKEPQF